MRTLILMRHAKSDWSRGVEDHARPLNARGAKAARTMAKWLRTAAPPPTEALVSDALRTVQTWEGLGFDGLVPSFTPRLYHAAPETMLAVLRAAHGDCVLMIGHNPGIAEFAALLAAAPVDHPDFCRYPTAAVTILAFDADTWATVAFGTGSVLAFRTPRDPDGA